MRGHTKVKMGLDVSLRCLRESTARLLRNLDMPEQPLEIVADVSALLKEMSKKINLQVKFIPGAIEEPTMSSAQFPEDAWKDIVNAQRKIYATLSMMNFAYQTFMSSRADSDTELSVHWVILHRIAEHARDLSDLVYATIDLYLLSLARVTVVPTTHLTRLRRGMMDAHEAILNTYIQTIQRQVAGEDDNTTMGNDDDDDDGNNNDNNSRLYSYRKKTGSHSSSSYSGNYNNENSITNNFNGNNNVNSSTNMNNYNNNNNNNNVYYSNNGASNINATTMAAPLISDAPFAPLQGTQTENTNVNKGNVMTSNNVNNQQQQQQQQQNVDNNNDNDSKIKSTNNNKNNNNKDDSDTDSSTDQDSDDDNDKNNKNRSRAAKNNSNKIKEKTTRSKSRVADNNNITNNDNNNDNNKEKTKKKGYLTYNLTPEEREKLKEFVNLKVNNSMFSRSFTNRNASFLNLSSLTAGLAANFGANASGPAEPENHNGQLLAMAGTDDGLAAELRKKHKISVETVEESAKRKDKDGNDESHFNDENNNNNGQDDKNEKSYIFNPASNAKNARKNDEGKVHNSTFALNESVLGGLFKRRASHAPQRKNDDHDNQSDKDPDSEDFFSAIDIQHYALRKRKNEIARMEANRANKENEACNTSLGAKDNTNSNLKFANKNQAKTNTSSFASIDGANDRNEIEMQSIQLASSQPNKSDILTSLKKVLLPAMASSAPSFSASKAYNILESNRSEEVKESAHISVPSSQQPNKVESATSTKDMETTNVSSVIPLSAENEESAHEQHLQMTGNDNAAHSNADHAFEIEEQSVFIPEEDVTGAHVIDVDGTHEISVNNNNKEEEEDSTNVIHNKLCKSSTVIEPKDEKSSLPCSNDSNKSHESDKNLLNSNNKTAPLCVSPNDMGTTGDAKNWTHKSFNNDNDKKDDAFDKSYNVNNNNSSGNYLETDVTKRNNASIYQNNNSITQPLQPFAKYAGDSSTLANDSHRPLIEFDNNGNKHQMDKNSLSDALNNLSFFDAERGEFILTNKDVHSLEAFLFGTRALVVYINELQNAILRMQHANEIAKQL